MNDKKETALLYAYQQEYKDYETAYDKLSEKIDDIELKIKFGGKNTIIIGNPEGLKIEDIIKMSKAEPKEYNIIVLGNIIGSTFSKNPIISFIPGETDKDKLFTYYKNIIQNKSYNDANIKFCIQDNVTFVMGNREIDLIKIKKLVKLDDGKKYGDFNDYLKDRTEVNFEVDNMQSFYPFWIKYYFRDSYQMPKENFIFIRRFKKIFKSIDAEMLLFTIYYEINKEKKNLDELTNLAIIYFYKMKDIVVAPSTSSPSTSSPSTSSPIKYESAQNQTFESLPMLEKLDYLAYYLFNYFSYNSDIDTLLTKAEFIFPLKVNKSYYLFSHGGLPNKLLTDNNISNLETFIINNYNLLTDSKQIKKNNNEDILELHNSAKIDQTEYYKKQITYDKCDTKEIEIDLSQSIETNITTSINYNKLLFNSLHGNLNEINKIVNMQNGGYVSKQTLSKYLGMYTKLIDFDDKKSELNNYNQKLKDIVKNLIMNDENIIKTDNKPTIELLLLLSLAHTFNSDIFKQLISYSGNVIGEIKSKDYSVLNNTIYDHRVKKNVTFKNVHQITANSNNTTQTTEVIYDSVFFGTIIDCYETETKLSVGSAHFKNYIISIDNSSIIKHYSYFDSVSCVFIAPDLKEILSDKNMAIYTFVTQPNKSGNIIIFNNLETTYKVLNHKIKEQSIQKIGDKSYKKKESFRESSLTFTSTGNLICQYMNYYGIDKNNEIIFSDSIIKAIKFHKYNF
jgi:hypothetical protein